MRFRVKYPFLLATLALLALVVCLAIIGAVSCLGAVCLLGLGQLAILCKDRARPALFTVGWSPAQFDEMDKLLKKIEALGIEWKELPERLRRVEMENDSLRADLRGLRKSGLAGIGSGVRWIGNKPFVSDDCAKALTSVFVLDCAKLKNGLESMIPDTAARERIIAFAAANLGLVTRAALDATTTPLPTVYVPQVIELVFKYGQARQCGTVFPLGAGTVKLPRLKAGEDDFGYFGAGTAGMSQPVTERQVTAELVTFTANKAGGLIRIPYEIEEDTFIPLGQFLARYIARQLAKLEDKAMFLADGSANYAGQTGIGPYCVANPAYLSVLAAGKTKPSDAGLADFRNLRAQVSPALLAGGFEPAYYINSSFEPMLRSFNQYPNFIVYENVNGQPRFDGWPVHWIGVSQSFVTQAAPSASIAFFGDLSYWYLGERGAPRIEVSREVFFATDEIAMRALERIDVEAMAVDAMATLQTAAE
jgi:HK97 family phage major capsid protein